MRGKRTASTLVAAVLFCLCAAAAAAPQKEGTAAVTWQRDKVPVFIDCDPGIDDTFALALAKKSPALQVLGIGAVQGNVGLGRTGANALSIASYIGLECPVALGATYPLQGVPMGAAYAHGSDGMGGVALPTPDRTFDRRPAWKLLYDTAKACDGQLQVIAIGPLTNIAKALELYPDLKDMLAGITVMGGSPTGLGNMTPSAEFNAFNDPWAMEAVLESGVDITVIGYDVTSQAVVQGDELEAMIGDSRIPLLLNGMRRTFVGEESDSKILNDVLAVMALTDPQVLTIEQGSLRCLTGRADRGTTVLTDDGSPVRYAVGLDREKMLDVLRRMCADYQK
ncbi:Non-specific ribonucleoside hydrolase rihC [Anaerotruncus sp. 2789STDY5834896]|uniref:Non-specific ribonucleoside hydrolase rihC n=1 Tax=uncultured Anaerotruncus sp. TaxID=905011 RepID=A0A1C6HKC5_9FIRM|nr:Non-specific ribonucleoside hydrolase rihC [uncultured Anaerotruncus sp.]